LSRFRRRALAARAAIESAPVSSMKSGMRSISASFWQKVS
jgi:hypothetical protein